ncbi:hypothetical protein ACROYT_G002423 [Oculina patagonica]
MASHSNATDWQSKILKKEYQNWLAVGHALSLMCDGLRPYIEREMKAFHRALLAHLASVPPCTCTRPPKHTCAWAAQLARCHRGGKPNSPRWHQSDSSKWTDPKQGYWEVAKLFMSDLGPSKAAVLDASKTDCTGLTNLLFWCVYFRVQVHLVDAVRDTRNTKWGHAARQELADGDKADALTTIRNLLQDPELVADNDAKSALAEINLMEKDFDAQSIERKVLADGLVTVSGQLDGIEDEIADFKRNCLSVSKKVQKKLLSLESKQTKVFKLLQSIDDRMEEERNRNVSYTTQGVNLAQWAFTGCKNTFVANLCSLNARSLTLWMALMVLMGSFKCLSHNSYNDGCPLESGSVPFNTKEFNFTRNLNAARESFTGRLWLYHDLDSLLTKEDIVRGVVVIGEPGTGKSALTAQLICSRASNPFIHKRIIGYHLCKHSDKATQDPGRFVRNLVDLMARRVPEYGMLVSNSSFILDILERSCLRDPYDCFEQAVVTPLRQLKHELREYFVVIDALDECSSYDGGTAIAQFIEETFSRLPKWIKLVMTSRNDSTVLKHFTNIPKVFLSPTDVRNLQDIEIFIATKLFEDAPFLDRLKVMLGFSSGEEISYLTNKLLSQSQGNFLFVKEMFHFWKDDWNNQIDFNQLPKTIGGIYESYLRRVYGSREKFKSALAVLEVLVATFEPMRVDRLFEVLRVQEKIDYEYDFVYALKGLSHFIRYGEDNTITIFHLSFTEWLTSKENLGNPYYVSRSHGHRRLAEYYLSVVKKAQNSSLDIYRLAQHVSFEESDDNHLEEFGNINALYINASIDRDNRTLLHLAAANSKRKILQILIPAFESIDCEDNYGFTPGFVAAMNGLTENIEYLLSKGANIEHRTKPPPSPSVLLDDAVVLADPIERAKTAFWNSSMLHAAASGGHIDVVQALLKRNASFRDVNGVNLTAIQLAAQNGHLKVVQFLHKCGALVDHVSLQHAAAGGHTDVVEFLLNTGVVDTCMRCDGSFYWLENRVRYQAKSHCSSGNAVDYILSDDKFKILCQSALHLAVAKNHTEVAKLLLSREDRTVHCTDFTGRTPLHEAVRQNHVVMAELLIQGGARISQKCRLFQNLSFSGNLTVKKCKTKYDFLSPREVVEYNEDLCHCGSSPFVLSARYGHTEVASLLLRYGAKPQEKDCQGATPLHIAACHGHYSFIKWLISQRPSLHINIRSKNQSTPLHSGAICKINEDIKPLIDMGASIYDTDQYGMTPLHYSVLNAFENVANVMFRTTTFDEPYGPSFITIWSLEGDVTVATDSRILSRTVPLNFQCLKLLEIIKSADDSYINKMDKNGRTALHLAAQNGEEWCVIYLLRKGARTDLTDNGGKTPLDVATDFAPEVLHPRFRGEDNCNMANFDLVLALNQRYHNAIAEILLSREAFLTQTCDERQTYLLHRAFEKEQPVIAYRILSKGGSLSCKDAQGRTPLLVYLQNGGKWLDVVLKRFHVTIHIECGKPFNKSEFHLLAYRKPTVASDNLLEDYTCDMCNCFSDDGPLLKAIKAHPLGFRVIDECRDAEGYTALHRAAQGGNLFIIKRFLSWGADPTVLTTQGHSPLTLAIMCAGFSLFPSYKSRNIAEKTADLLLRATRRISNFNIGCNTDKLTIYHLSAYRGLEGFIKTLLKDTTLPGIDVNCSNQHGITPLYLAKLYVGTEEPFKGKNDQWQEIVDLIERQGGVLTYPTREAELNVIYKHIFGSHPEPFTLDEFEADMEKFYKNEFSVCREDDLNHYETGTMINPYDEAVQTELTEIIRSNSVTKQDFELVPRDRDMMKQTLDILLLRQQALRDLSQLFEDVLAGFERTKVETKRRNAIINNTTTLSIQLPKFTWPKLMQQLLQLKKRSQKNEQRLHRLRFKHHSSLAIMHHKNRYLKQILHKYSGVYGERTKFVKLLEQFEESELCMDELFQARLITMKFHNYVHRSRVDDFASFRRVSLLEAEFLSKRMPREWTEPTEDGWNQAVKFLYQQATQKDLAFDYLKDLSLGYDKETRIPLSVDALCGL